MTNKLSNFILDRVSRAFLEGWYNVSDLVKPPCYIPKSDRVSGTGGLMLRAI